MYNPELANIEEVQALPPPNEILTPDPSRLRQNVGRALAALTLGIAASVATETMNPDTAEATNFVNNYPYMEAREHPGEYQWWVDENGNGVYDDQGELISPMGFYYKNCVDGVAHWVKSYMGITIPGSWRSGSNWDEAASAAGYIVKPGNAKNIETGDIAQSDDGAGGHGHVGLVTEVAKDSHGNVTKIKLAELNGAGNGKFTHDPYSSKNSQGKFIRSSSKDMDWDHFIDVNGIGKGLEGSIPEPRPQETSTIPWSFTTLEGDRNSLSGREADTGHTPTAVEFNDKLYAFSYNKTNGDLRMASTNGNSWNFTTLEGDPGSLSRNNANVGQTPAAVVYNNTLHSFYYSPDGGDLRHAWSADGKTWKFETLDGAGGSNGRRNANIGQTPVAVEYNGTLQLFYRDATNTTLRHAWTSPTQGWRFEDLEGTNGSISGYNANVGHDPTATVWNNQLHLLHYDQSAGNLRHVRTGKNTGWKFENLDGDPGSICGLNADVGKNPAITAHGDSMHTLFYDKTNGNLRHAWTGKTEGWKCETLEGDNAAALGYNSDVGAMPTIASVGGNLQAFAYEPQWGALRHYWWDRNGTRSENFDGLGGGPAGRQNTYTGLDPFVISYKGKVYTFYHAHGAGDLRVAVSK